MTELMGRRTSFIGIFGADPAGGRGLGRIEIPRLQRDYAQGRADSRAKEIRANFLTALLDALETDEPVGLDFVYGKAAHGTLIPLDGQQRLTTLFLLHWYLGSITDPIEPDVAWIRFSYETRASARLFCERLVRNPIPAHEGPPSAWITDQSWYLQVWQDDPTIRGMLVMLDAIDDGMKSRPGLNPSDAWQRLTDEESPAIWFYLLPLDDLDSDEDMYITMNSRGKPLTEFENFKARFEQDIRESPRAAEFARKIDTIWSDLLWNYRGDNNIVDDEFLRYIDFATTICEYIAGGAPDPEVPLGRRATAGFAPGSEQSKQFLDFLFEAFDTWCGQDSQVPVNIAAVFGSLFSTTLPGDVAYDPARVVLYGQWARDASGAMTTDLFDLCVHRFDSTRIRTPRFSLQQSLLLYAVLFHRIWQTPDLPRRLRILRNLVAASDNEVRRATMPGLLEDVGTVLVTGDVNEVSGFGRSQAEDENLKREFLSTNPELAATVSRLEDHPILRGTLSAFEFDAASFSSRAAAFESAFAPDQWPALARALLATGDYQRQRPNTTTWLLGASSANRENAWRDLLTGTSRQALAQTRAVLASFLDAVAASDQEIDEHLARVTDSWLAEREASARFDWRYYLVKYPDRLQEATGVYHTADGAAGYVMCMLRTLTTSGGHRDPILLAVHEQSVVGDRVQDPIFRFEWGPHWLRLDRSGTGIRSTPDGFALKAPEDAHMAQEFLRVCSRLEGITDENGALHLRIPQTDIDGHQVDSVDRVQAGAELVRQLAAAGL